MANLVHAFVIVLLCGLTVGAPEADEIVSLPGLDYSINFKHYSGYLQGEADKMLHYWFVESQGDPAKDPVVLWMNGGPGCSSLDGLLDELGPYHVNPNGTALYENKYSWNKIASVLFLESPACVGFSYDVNNNCSTGDDAVAASNYLAILDFFAKFPEFKENEFFITGESYGGIYVPMLSVLVHKNMANNSINFKGFAVGNGLSSYQLNDDSLMYFGYFHGLFGLELWDQMVESCCKGGRYNVESCNFTNSPFPKCNVAVAKAMAIIYGGQLNVYNLYQDCYHPVRNNSVSRYEVDLDNIFRTHPSHSLLMQQNKKRLQEHQLRSDPPCTDATNLRKYLNSDDVRKALHIPDSVAKWDICNDEVAFTYQHQYSDMKDQYNYLTQHVRGLVYNGDIDMACNFLGDEWFVEGLKLQVTEKRKMWFENEQVGGFAKQFENIDLVTIRGAGHMVPQDKPSPALKMITSFLKNEPY